MTRKPLLIRDPGDISTGRCASQFPLRFPDGLREEIKAAAKANGRSMNAELVARLTVNQPVAERLDGIEAKLDALTAYFAEADTRERDARAVNAILSACRNHSAELAAKMLTEGFCKIEPRTGDEHPIAAAIRKGGA